MLPFHRPALSPRNLAILGGSGAVVAGLVLVIAFGGVNRAVPAPSLVATQTATMTAVPASTDTTTPMTATPQSSPSITLVAATGTAIPTDTAIPTNLVTASPTAEPSPLPTATPKVVVLTGPVAVPRRADAPIELKISKINVDAQVETVGVDRTGAMATPTTPFRVGWFGLGVVPGHTGNAVIDGHLDSAVFGAAVFWRLSELKVGDLIQLTMPDNHVLTFVVDKTAVYPYNDAPLGEIFGPSSQSRLNLVTCNGIFDRSSKNYDRRLVVFSHLVSGSNIPT